MKYYNGQTTKKVTIVKGSVFNPTDTVKLTAYQSAANDSVIGLQLVSNNVNTNVPGTYNVKFSATNSNGLSSTVTVPVEVVDGYYNDSISYVAGYGVNTWRTAGTTDATWTGNRLLHGTAVRTWDSKVVNGTSYTRVTLDTDRVNGKEVTDQATAQGVNRWVQSSYLASNKGTTNPSTPAGETAVKGVATVVYSGKGKVALRDGNDKVTGKQYVANGSKWKVFAKKTVNGQVLYRLGSQSQWIRAGYVTVK